MLINTSYSTTTADRPLQMRSLPRQIERVLLSREGTAAARVVVAIPRLTWKVGRKQHRWETAAARSRMLPAGASATERETNLDGISVICAGKEWTQFRDYDGSSRALWSAVDMRRRWWSRVEPSLKSVWAGCQGHGAKRRLGLATELAILWPATENRFSLSLSLSLYIYIYK